jgi:hypothetical protein
MARSAQTESRINQVAKDLSVGMERKDILLKYAKIWKIANSSIDHYIEWAKPVAQSLNKTIKESIDTNTVDQEIIDYKTKIKDKYHRLYEIQKIADGKGWKSGNVLIVPTAGDRIRAYDFIAKVEGDYAPAKLEHSGATEVIIQGKKFAESDENKP